MPPGAADTIHYRLDIPPDAGDKIVLRAKVNYRKFAWWNTQWAFAGVRDPGDPNPSVTPSHDDGRWVFTGNTANVSGQVKALRYPTTIMAENAAALRGWPRARRFQRRSPSWIRRCASDGTTTGLVCCCRAISRMRKRRSKVTQMSRHMQTAGQRGAQELGRAWPGPKRCSAGAAG